MGIKREGWEKRIIEYFILRSSFKAYSASHKTLLDNFHNYKNATEFKNAIDHLKEIKTLIPTNETKNSSESDQMFILNIWEKGLEISDIFQKEPIKERAKMNRPDPIFFNNLTEQFTFTTERAWPNQGTYYVCTHKNASDNWIILIQTRPNHKPTKLDLGSIKQKDSRISIMWSKVIEVWVNNHRKPFVRKKAEDIDQKTFGNNRQRGAAAFAIFRHFKWIKESHRKGAKIYYKVINEETHPKILKNKIHICPYCGMPVIGNFCHNCNRSIS